MGAGLQQNMGPVWGPKALSEMTSTAINPVYQSVTDSYVKIIASDRKRKATPAAKEKRTQNKYFKIDNSVQAWKAYSSLASYLALKEGLVHCLRMCRKNNGHSPKSGEFVYLLRITPHSRGDLLAGMDSLASATPERDGRTLVRCFYLCSATNQ